jgi:hypothetical protein
VHALAKYLRGHAEPETALAARVSARYARVLVVPAYREGTAFLDGYVRAAAAAPDKTLCVVVANGPIAASDDERAEDVRTLDGLVARLADAAVLTASGAPRAWLGALDEHLDVLVVDRVSEGARFPPKRGVGLARKIGADLALALHAAGSVASPLLHFTDADAELPEDYFVRPIPDDIAAVVYPFTHTPTADVRVSRATALYEVSLRYYVAGLAWAGSPYAFHTIGSTIAVSAEAYAAVRGVPPREAAEDFYLLNKLAKVGCLFRAPGAPIRLRSRTSNRVPFGTGASVDAFSTDDVVFYAPRCFDVLRLVLTAFDAFAEHAEVARFYETLASLGDARETVLRVLGEFATEEALVGAGREAKTPLARRVRAHSFFDAFRALKVIHAVRDHVAPSIPFRSALALAPFVPREAAISVDASFWESARAVLDLADHALPASLGPAVRAARFTASS